MSLLFGWQGQSFLPLDNFFFFQETAVRFGAVVPVLETLEMIETETYLGKWGCDGRRPEPSCSFDGGWDYLMETQTPSFLL